LSSPLDSQKKKPLNILVLVSGGGTNLQALLNAFSKSTPPDSSGDNVTRNIKIAAVLSDREGAGALERARAANIPALLEKPDSRLPKPQRRQELSDRILHVCREKQIGLIVFAGFLSILAGDIIKEYSGKMINIHPALLPKFGGEGMHGERVHKAVLAAGETESGCTVHLVDAGTDTGPILLQRKAPVLPGDTAASLAERVLKEEHIAIVEGVNMMAAKLEGYNE